MQTAADTIRNGSLLSSSKHTEATGDNSDASPQVETSLDVPRVRVKRTPEEDILRRESNALRTLAYQEKEDKQLGIPTSPKSQAVRTRQLAIANKELAEVKRLRDQAQERLRPSGENPTGQRVLTETFCKQTEGNSSVCRQY